MHAWLNCERMRGCLFKYVFIRRGTTDACKMYKQMHRYPPFYSLLPLKIVLRRFRVNYSKLPCSMFLLSSAFSNTIVPLYPSCPSSLFSMRFIRAQKDTFLPSWTQHPFAHILPFPTTRLKYLPLLIIVPFSSLSYSSFFIS